MTTGTGKWCSNGSLTFRAEDMSATTSGYPVCKLCLRRVRLRKDGRISKHVWQTKLTNIDVGDHSSNSQANRAMRAFERTRK